MKYLILTIFLFSTETFAQPIILNMPSSTILRRRISYIFVSPEKRREKDLSSDTKYLMKEGDKYFARLSQNLSNKRLCLKELIDTVISFTKNTKNKHIQQMAWNRMPYILIQLVIDSKEAFYELEEIEKNLEVKRLKEKESSESVKTRTENGVKSEETGSNFEASINRCPEDVIYLEDNSSLISCWCNIV